MLIELYETTCAKDGRRLQIETAHTLFHKITTTYKYNPFVSYRKIRNHFLHNPTSKPRKNLIQPRSY